MRTAIFKTGHLITSFITVIVYISVPQFLHLQNKTGILNANQLIDSKASGADKNSIEVVNTVDHSQKQITKNWLYLWTKEMPAAIISEHCW